MGNAARKNSGKVGSFTCKRRGEVVEAEFLAKAARLGFRVSKPWGDSERYDFIVEAEIGLWRVQVKSTTCRRGPKYLLALAGHRQPYNEQEIDFLVV